MPSAETLAIQWFTRLAAELEPEPWIIAYVDGPRVLVDVTYDDGSLQDWADTTYGDGVVVVHSMLVS